MKQLRGSEAVQVERARSAGRRHGLPARCPEGAVGLGCQRRQPDGVTSYTIATDPTADVREELAKAVVDGGYGLLRSCGWLA